MNTIVLSGSIRSSQDKLDEINELTKTSANLDDYISNCKNRVKNGIIFCNSDILAGASLLAMRNEGATPSYFSLSKLFSKSENRKALKPTDLIRDNISVETKEQQLLLDKISNSNGIVLITPVYFGDRSSVANKIMQIAGKNGILKGKIFGASSVGAKRNGGQETATLYCLFEALRNGALVVGNGPPTSQYGGTAVGGHKGTILNDEWGLATTYGVASRVSQVSKFCVIGKLSNQHERLRILILVTMDNNNRFLLKHIKKHITTLEIVYPDVDFIVLDALKYKIYRCLGCKYCPDTNNQVEVDPAQKKPPSCRIKNPDDGMHEIHSELAKADGILIAGLNLKNAMDINYRYQVLIERTRYIRRNNFELSNKLISSLTINEVGATVNQLHHVKTVTSYIRHNVAMCKPVEIFIHNGKIIADGDDAFHQFIVWSKIIKQGHRNVYTKPPEYLTTGIGGYD